MRNTSHEQKTETPVSVGEEDIRQYLSEIRRYPILTAEEERNLAMRCAAGDEAAIRQMVNSNLRLVVSIAKDYTGRGIPLMDLIQEGSIGLIAAAKKFDYTLENRFSTFATKLIKQVISRYLADHGCMIRVPDHTADRIRQVQTARKALIQELGKDPTEGEIAARCGMSVKKVRQLIQLSPEICSLSAPTGVEDGSLGDLLEDVQSEKPYEQLVREELSRTMEVLLGTLSERHRQVLRMHYGMEEDGKCYSFEKISKEMNLSKERVRQIEKQAMEKLQKAVAGMGLEDFL